MKEFNELPEWLQELWSKEPRLARLAEKDIKAVVKQVNNIPRGHYNEAPEGLVEITLDEWQRGMFLYCLEKSDSKQVRRDGQTFDLRLFDVPNFNNDKIGFAIMNDWFDNETGRIREKNIVRFCRYGTEQQWKDFDRAFVGQFAGDNS